jgi:CRP-like cAMP-binding protein
MAGAFVRKLLHGADLNEADCRALADAVSTTQLIAPRTDLIEEGDRPSVVHVVLDGFACRYKTLEDGGRQILAWLVPGDCCDFQVSLGGRMDHAIATISGCRMAYLPRGRVETLLLGSPAITRALWWSSLVDEAILREWLTGMGRRPADRRIAHLLCEILTRLEAVGLVEHDTFELPVTQIELADTVGLSSVHVNRTIQEMRDRGLVSWTGSHFTVLKVNALKSLAEFDPNYLHLDARSN